MKEITKRDMAGRIIRVYCRQTFNYLLYTNPKVIKPTSISIQINKKRDKVDKIRRLIINIELL